MSEESCLPVKGHKERSRFTVEFSKEILDKVEAERVRRGYNASAPIYKEALKFYFDNKDNPLYMTPDQIDAKIDAKVNAILTDPVRLMELKKAIFNI